LRAGGKTMGGKTHSQIKEKYICICILSSGASARREPKTKTETTTEIAGAVQN